MDKLYLFYVMALAVIVTFAVTPLVIVVAKRMHLVDDVRKRKHPANTHTGVIPRAGGLAIFVSILATALLFIPMGTLLFRIKINLTRISIGFN